MPKISVISTILLLIDHINKYTAAVAGRIRRLATTGQATILFTECYEHAQL